MTPAAGPVSPAAGPGAPADWRPDSLLEGYEQLVLPLPGARRAPGEPEDGPALTGTLVRRNPPARARALLYVHGWNDYFFQTHLADAVDSLGFDFYALDLRRFGRNLHPGELPGFIDSLDDYDAELDAAMAELRASHESITLMAHSAGGLVSALWADRHPGQVHGLILNSPWLAQHGPPLVRVATAPVLNVIGGRYPTQVIPLANNGLYARTIDAALDGEWQLEERLKNTTSFQLRVGWLAAILEGHQRVAAGLGIDCPVLTLVSARSVFLRAWDDRMKRADTVLDVEQIAAASVRLGSHVTLVRIEGGLHDLALSSPEVRAVYFDEITRWVGAYL